MLTVLLDNANIPHREQGNRCEIPTLVILHQALISAVNFTEYHLGLLKGYGIGMILDLG